MNPQPTIFISSIISEFYDLRGSLKYFLGKSGFRVLMSEESDFGADCGLDSLDNCQNQIEKADYFLLLIGDKPGTIFELNKNETTVTFEEFRHYINLVKSGKSLNFIVFIRKQTWTNFENKDHNKIHPLQFSLISELLENSLFEDKKIGRWRYTFDRFGDIISALETNQNGLFLEATRKINLYRTYIKREIYDIFKTLLEKSIRTNQVKSITEIIRFPKIDHLDYFIPSKIDPDSASRISVFLVIISNKDTLLRKVNRVFNYIAQGEFSQFDPIEEKYVLPEYIKLTQQTLEILEKVFDNSKNMNLLDQIRQRNPDNFTINNTEYDIAERLYSDLNTVITKLANLTVCFSKNWTDFAKQPDSFYSYGRVSGLSISDQELIDFADNFFKKDKT
jgi:hypothetical protein